MHARRLIGALLVGALFLVSACGGGSDDSAADRPSTNGGRGAGDLGDFPVPLPGWADGVSPNLSNELDVVLFMVPLDRRAATIAFYEDWTANQPENYIRTDGASGGVTFQTEVKAGEKKTTVAVLAPIDGDDFVSVSLTVGIFG